MASMYGRITVVADSVEEYFSLISAVNGSPDFSIVLEDETELRIVVDLATS